jgi:hypothetical protein
MTTAEEILALVGLAIGLVVLLVVLALFHNVIRPALESDRYARSILDAGIGIAKNLDPVPALLRTRELALAVPGLAVAYLKKLGLV